MLVIPQSDNVRTLRYAGQVKYAILFHHVMQALIDVDPLLVFD